MRRPVRRPVPGSRREMEVAGASGSGREVTMGQIFQEFAESDKAGCEKREQPSITPRRCPMPASG